MIRLGAIWLATAPLDMRAGTETGMARVVTVFGSAQASHAYCPANARGARMKALIHDSFGIEGKVLHRSAIGYAHVRQVKRWRKVLKHQRTTHGIVLREVKRKLGRVAADLPPANSQGLQKILVRVRRLRKQQTKDGGKLYALHAP